MLTVESVVGQAVNDGLGDDNVTDYLLGKISEAAASAALGYWGFIPLIIETESRPAVTYQHHIRTTMSGTFTSTAGEEMWTCGTSWSVAGNAVPDKIPDEAMSVLYGAATTYIGLNGNGVPGFSADVTLRSVEYQHVLPTGKIGGGQVQRYFGTPVVGATDFFADYASSVAITLDAGGAKGGRYGRFYPPPQKLQMSAGTLQGSQSGICRDAALAWLTSINAALNAAIGPDVALCVASQLNGGQNRNVASIRCGRVPDHISRRRRGLSEAYVNAAWPPA